MKPGQNRNNDRKSPEVNRVSGACLSSDLAIFQRICGRKISGGDREGRLSSAEPHLIPDLLDNILSSNLNLSSESLFHVKRSIFVAKERSEPDDKGWLYDPRRYIGGSKRHQLNR